MTETPSTDEQVGKHMEAIRKARRVTQATLAMHMQRAGANWTQVTVSLVEKGKRPLRLVEAHHVAALLAVSIDTLINGSPELTRWEPVAA